MWSKYEKIETYEKYDHGINNMNWVQKMGHGYKQYNHVDWGTTNVTWVIFIFIFGKSYVIKNIFYSHKKKNKRAQIKDNKSWVSIV